MNNIILYENEISNLKIVKGCIFKGTLEGKEMFFRFVSVGAFSGLRMFERYYEDFYICKLNYN